MENKKTAVDFLIENIEIALKLNKVEINPIYRFKTIIPIFTMAKEMEREQIIESFMEGTKMDNINDELSSRFNACIYYGENYGGEK